MTFSQIRQYVTGLLRKSFKNKEILDKIGDNNGVISYNGINITNSIPDSELSSTSINSLQNKVITQSLNEKVDKQLGKGLSTNDFTNDLKTKLDNLENYDDGALTGKVSSLESNISDISNSISDINNTLTSKVDAEEGKGLSEENFTESHKNNLERITSNLGGYDNNNNQFLLYYHYNPSDNMINIANNVILEYGIKNTEEDFTTPIPVNVSDYVSFIKVTNALIIDLLKRVSEQEETIQDLESRVSDLES